MFRVQSHTETNNNINANHYLDNSFHSSASDSDSVFIEYRLR